MTAKKFCKYEEYLSFEHCSFLACVLSSQKPNFMTTHRTMSHAARYFPLLLKEHTSHDVLLMCPPCHRVSSDHDGVMRSQLAVECGAPLNSGENSSFYQDHFLQQVKSAGRSVCVPNSCFICMCNLWICVISDVHPSDWPVGWLPALNGKYFNVGHNAKASQPYFSYLSCLLGTTGINHFMSLWVTLTLAES